MQTLKRDAKQRISLEEIVNSAWIGNSDPFPENEPDNAESQVLGTFVSSVLIPCGCAELRQHSRSNSKSRRFLAALASS